MYLIAKLLYFMKDFVEVFIKLFQVQYSCGISLLQVQSDRNGIGLLQRNNGKTYCVLLNKHVQKHHHISLKSYQLLSFCVHLLHMLYVLFFNHEDFGQACLAGEN